MSLLNRKRTLLLSLTMASALIVGFVWKVNAISRQNRLNHDLIQVVAHNEQATVQQLLAAGADPNARNVPGADRETDFLSTLRSLFRKEPRKTLEYGRQTVLSIALSNDDIRLVRLLLDAGADVNLRWGSGYTPLIDAALSSEEEAIVKLLLERGADVNARDPEGRTALQLARKAWYRPISVNRSVARLIEQAGAKEQEKREERPR